MGSVVRNDNPTTIYTHYTSSSRPTGLSHTSTKLLTQNTNTATHTPPIQAVYVYICIYGHSLAMHVHTHAQPKTTGFARVPIYVCLCGRVCIYIYRMNSIPCILVVVVVLGRSLWRATHTHTRNTVVARALYISADGRSRHTGRRAECLYIYIYIVRGGAVYI